MTKSGTKVIRGRDGRTRCHKCRRFLSDLKRHKCPMDQPPKKRKNPNKKKQPVISTETYNRLWDAYREKQNVSHCARSAGVNMKTAERYINGPGAPQYMMHPIAARWARVQSAAVEEEDLTLAKFRRETLNDLVLPGLKMLESERLLASQELRSRLELFRKDGTVKGRMQFGTYVKTLDRLARLGERLLGGADLKVDSRVGGLEAEFADWTEEELIEYSTTGRRPKDMS